MQFWFRVFYWVMGFVLVGVCVDIIQDSAPVSPWVKLAFVVVELLLASCCFWLAAGT